jgi:hypothetical protein
MHLAQSSRIDPVKLTQIMCEPSESVAFNRLRRLLEKYMGAVHLGIESGDQVALSLALAMLEEVAKLTEFNDLLHLLSVMHTASREKNWLQCKVVLAAMQQEVVEATRLEALEATAEGAKA